MSDQNQETMDRRFRRTVLKGLTTGTIGMVGIGSVTAAANPPVNPHSVSHGTKSVLDLKITHQDPHPEMAIGAGGGGNIGTYLHKEGCYFVRNSVEPAKTDDDWLLRSPQQPTSFTGETEYHQQNLYKSVNWGGGNAKYLHPHEAYSLFNLTLSPSEDDTSITVGHSDAGLLTVQPNETESTMLPEQEIVIKTNQRDPETEEQTETITITPELSVTNRGVRELYGIEDGAVVPPSTEFTKGLIRSHSQHGFNVNRLPSQARQHMPNHALTVIRRNWGVDAQ